jgi:hypothetical protein
LLLRKTSKPRTKRCCTHVGLLIPKATATQPHTSLAIGQSKKRCWTVSCCAQKPHFVHPFHLRFTKLSLVSTTPLLRNHRKILIFNDNLAFQAQQLTRAPALKIKSLYKFLTENVLLAVQRKQSLYSVRDTSMTLPTRSSQSSQSSPTNARLKEMFNGVVLST